MTLTTLEDYVKREIFKTDKELFDFCPACDETGNTIEALMKGLFQEEPQTRLLQRTWQVI